MCYPLGMDILFEAQKIIDEEEDGELERLALTARASRATVENWIKGNAIPGKKHLENVKTAYPELTFNDLFSIVPEKKRRSECKK